MTGKLPAGVEDDAYCYLLTIGRRTGLQRETEIWFAIDNDIVYVLAGSGESAYWVRNLRANPGLDIRFREATLPFRARDVATPEEDSLARKLLVEKYQPGHGSDLTSWGKTALPLAFEARI